jgi:hypothetical protein
MAPGTASSNASFSERLGAEFSDGFGNRYPRQTARTAYQGNTPKPMLKGFLGSYHPLATLIEVRPQLAKLPLQLQGSFHAPQYSDNCYNCKVNLLTLTK